MTGKSNPPRITCFNSAKAILAFLVVPRHAPVLIYDQVSFPNVLLIIMYAFQISAFISISDLFSKHASNAERKSNVNRIISFLALYLFLFADFWGTKFAHRREA